MRDNHRESATRDAAEEAPGTARVSTVAPDAPLSNKMPQAGRVAAGDDYAGSNVA